MTVPGQPDSDDGREQALRARRLQMRDAGGGAARRAHRAAGVAGIPGDYAVDIGDDDCACLSEAAVRVLLPSLARNFIEIIGPNLDVIDFGFHDTT